MQAIQLRRSSDAVEVCSLFQKMLFMYRLYLSALVVNLVMRLQCYYPASRLCFESGMEF
jgi:hypothetical protein